MTSRGSVPSGRWRCSSLAQHAHGRLDDGRRSSSTTAGSTSVSGESGTPRSPIPRELELAHRPRLTVLGVEAQVLATTWPVFWARKTSSKTFASRAAMVANGGGSVPTNLAPAAEPSGSVTLTLFAATSLRLVRVTKILNVSPERITPGTVNDTSK
jgi:hypothetical protein